MVRNVLPLAALRSDQASITWSLRNFFLSIGNSTAKRSNFIWECQKNTLATTIKRRSGTESARYALPILPRSRIPEVATANLCPSKRGSPPRRRIGATARRRPDGLPPGAPFNAWILRRPTAQVR